MERVLPCTVRPDRASELMTLAREQHGGSVKSLVAKLVDLSCRHCIRKCKESCKHDRAIICKGRKGFGLGLFVFTYDQRIPTSLWDHHTVLRRGLTVLVPLPEPFRDREEHVRAHGEDGSPLELSVLEEATQNDSPLEVAECMPKFFEADESVMMVDDSLPFEVTDTMETQVRDVPMPEAIVEEGSVPANISCCIVVFLYVLWSKIYGTFL
eukprot:g16108.t1